MIAVMAVMCHAFSMSAGTSITIRKLEAGLKQKLRMRAAAHGRSMEEEAREILRVALASEPGSGKQLVESIRRRFSRAGYVELKAPIREPMREPPDFR